MKRFLFLMVLLFNAGMVQAGNVSLGFDLSGGRGLTLNGNKRVLSQGRSDVYVLLPLSENFKIGPVFSGYAVGNYQSDYVTLEGYNFGVRGDYRWQRLSLSLGVGVGNLNHIGSDSHLTHSTIDGRIRFAFYQGEAVTWDIFAAPTYSTMRSKGFGVDRVFYESYGIGFALTPETLTFRSRPRHVYFDAYDSFRTIEFMSRLVIEIGPRMAYAIAKAL